MNENFQKKSLDEKFWKETQLRNAIDNLQDGFAILRAVRNDKSEIIDFIFDYINISGARTINTPQNDAIGKNILSILPKFNKTILFKKYSEVTNTGIPQRIDETFYHEAVGSKIMINGIFEVNVTKFEDGVLISWRDVAEQRRITQELKLSKEQFRIAISEAPFPLIIYADDGEILNINKTWTEQTGYSLEEISTIDIWVEKAYGENKNFIREEIQKLFDTEGKSANGEFKVNTKSGKKIIFDFITSPLGELPDGRKALLSMASNVTERKSAEEKIAYQAKLLDNANDAIFGLDTEIKITYWNKGAENTYGFKAEEIIGHNFHELIKSTNSSETTQKIIQALQETGSVQVEVKQFHKDGNLIVIESKTQAIKDEKENIIGYVSVNSDITSRKAVEEALKQSEEKFRLALANSNVSVFQMDNELKYVWIYNPILRKNYINAINKTDFDLLPVDEAERITANKKETLQNGIARKFEECFTFNNEKHYYDIFIEPVKNNEDKIEGLRGVAIDITERKELELRLLNTLNELERSNRDLEQFAYVASHDLQEPLRTILNYTKLIDRRYKDKLDATGIDFINFVVNASSRMNRLIFDLLSYSRLATRQKPFVQVELNKTLTHVIGSLNTLIEETRTEISVPELPTVSGDEIQLGQLFQNLINNAIKFRKDENPKIVIICERKNNYWLFGVKDNGIGIDSSYKEKIFVIFQRLHTESEYPGTGIGLALCKKIVEHHHGKIWFESKLGEGATFYFTIPINHRSYF